MDQMVEDDFGNDFVDLEAVAIKEDEDFGSDFPDLEEAGHDYEKGKPTWSQKLGDVLVQSGRGVLRAFTWPADVIKAGIIGEAFTDIDDLESAFNKAGKHFDRDEYVKSVYDMVEYFPTQDTVEKGIESATGLSFEPKTELGRKAGQLAGVATLSPGSLARKVGAGVTAAATTYGLEQAGVPGAEVIGDIAGFSTNTLKKTPRFLSQKATERQKIAEKHALPFLEYTARDKAPLIKGKLNQNAENVLKREFNTSVQGALDKILTNEIPIKALRDKGINLDVMAEKAYSKARLEAQSRPQIIKTDQMVNNIDQEIHYIRSLAPSPTNAQKVAINLLESERDILKVSKSNSEQLINQYQNYNAEMKQIYAHDKFKGADNEVRKSYEFLKKELVKGMEEQGHKDVATYFNEANKIYHAKSKLDHAEELLAKAFDGENFSGKKLEKVLASKQGKILRRNIGKDAINDMKEVAKYAKEAQEKINGFIKLDSPFVTNEISAWGNVAPFLLIPNKLTGAMFSVARVVGQRAQGKLLTRPALRESYKMTMKHAAEGQFNLLKKDFMKLREGIEREWGDEDTFIDEIMQDLKFERLD